ncbi:uncharacterized protein N7483_001138 [Penicillium malachiteum]|uniref:uncharacterized protein n=1 Tax=Penicillium malachiteum TaxID=1324776 RepID=UPI002546CBFA|nr:uncharacterized protein N7483_001138 [Penicillium malachiteum]KAJ5736013.1 hypothetical protein N7483_001138 [Penicillium malachiteum]
MAATTEGTTTQQPGRESATRLGEDIDVNETTSLLKSAKAEPADVRLPGQQYGATTEANGDVVSEVDSQDEKPLPLAQILFLCYARAIEPLAFFSIFPYVSQMVQDNGNVPDSDIGFYSGLIESMFSLTQAMVMLFWGRLADRIGRKPVLVFSLLGVTVATSLFGTARSIGQMILFRCIAGVFAGTIVTIRTMVAEHSTPATQARAFSWFAFSGNLGIFLGPLLGGALADPVRQYPGLFGGMRFFEDYPYALSSFVVAIIGATAAMSTAFFVEETLKKEPAAAGVDDNEALDNISVRHQNRDMTTWELLKAPGVATVIYVYGHLMVLAFAYTAIIPVFWFTPVSLGGYGFTPMQISLLMGMNGAAQAAWLLLVFPPLQKRIGTKGVIRLCAAAYPCFLLACPFGNVLLRIGTKAAINTFWVFVPLSLIIGCGVSMSFTAAQLAINDVSPSPRVLGTLNAVSLTSTSVLRAFTPALSTTLFALGARSQLLAGHAIWLFLALFASGLLLATKYLPEPPKTRKRQSSQES